MIPSPDAANTLRQSREDGFSSPRALSGKVLFPSPDKSRGEAMAMKRVLTPVPRRL